MFIQEVKPRLIKNSRGEKTIEIELRTLKGRFISSAPSGKSKGMHEKRDYNERGIGYSLKLVKKLGEKLKHQNFILRSFIDLKKFEIVLHKFESDFGLLGANVTFALESVFLKAAAYEKGKELWEFIYDSFFKDRRKIKMPMPVGNCIGGGLHSHSNKKPDFQEFLLIAEEKKFSKAVTKLVHAYHYLEHLLKKKQKKWRVKKNDENALQTSLTNEEVLDLMKIAARKYKLKSGLDVAASSFFKDGYYKYKNKKLTRDKREQVDYIEHLVKKYKIFYIEDGIHEEDYGGFLELNKTLGEDSMIVGDDLSVTNLHRLQRAVHSKAINAVIIKPNQNGYLIDVAKVIVFCKKNNIKIIISHRSGETMDNALADLAIGFQADFIKTGISGKERLVKLKRLMEIEKGL